MQNVVNISQIEYSYVILQSAEGGNETGDAAVGGLTSAMFNSLLQGVMEEVAGVMRGQQSTNTVAHFLRNLPDFTYTTVDFPRESFLFDLFMTMVFDFYSASFAILFQLYKTTRFSFMDTCQLCMLSKL